MSRMRPVPPAIFTVNLPQTTPKDPPNNPQTALGVGGKGSGPWSATYTGDVRKGSVPMGSVIIPKSWKRICLNKCYISMCLMVCWGLYGLKSCPGIISFTMQTLRSWGGMWTGIMNDSDFYHIPS